MKAFPPLKFPPRSSWFDKQGNLQRCSSDHMDDVENRELLQAAHTGQAQKAKPTAPPSWLLWSTVAQLAFSSPRTLFPAG